MPTPPNAPASAGAPDAIPDVVEPTSTDPAGRFASLRHPHDPAGPAPAADRAGEDIVEPIPVTADGRLVVAPASSADRAVRHMRHLTEDGLNLPDDSLIRLAQSVVEPGLLTRAVLAPQRTEYGWIYQLHARAWITMLNVAVANDRLVARAVYAADPGYSAAAGGNLAAVALPSSDPAAARLVFDDDLERILDAADRNFAGVLANNPQQVGARLIERPLTVVVQVVVAPDGTLVAHELATVDGNSRLSSGLAELHLQPEWLPARLRRNRVTDRVTPSLLMNLDLAERRELTRRMAHWATTRLAQPPRTGPARAVAADHKERDRAARTLNALTAPVEVIVGFRDDDPARYGNERFASAVRSLLVRMNVAVTAFDDGARNAVQAEEVALGLHAEGLIDDTERDILIGRSDVSAAMAAKGLDPTLADLRFAYIAWQLTRTDGNRNRVIRTKLHERRLLLKHREPLVVELGLRSYSATWPEGERGPIRRALDSGCLWQRLVERPWGVESIATDDDVDVLAEYALEQRATGGYAASLLGVLGMVALVMSGHLLAPGAAAERLVGGEAVDRTDVGSIVSKLLDLDWGVWLLRNAIKASRAGAPIAWIDDHGEPDDRGWTPAQFDAQLRLAVHRRSLRPVVGNPADELRQGWTEVTSAIVRARDSFEAYEELRHEHAATNRLLWVEVEGAIANLDYLTDSIKYIAERPRGDR